MATATAATPARAVAHTVLRRTFDEGAYTDRALLAEARRAGLDARDRALATRLAYGTVQRRAALDFVIERLAERPVRKLDPPVRDALRLGLFQLLHLDGIPVHAAVAESVELAKQAAPRGAGLVNAVLRRAAGGEARAILDAVGDATPQAAATTHSHPEWIAELWWEALGPDHARRLMAADNEPAEVVLRANALTGMTAARLAERLREAGHDARPADAPPEAVLLDGPFDAHADPLHRAGAYMPQSRASATVARIVDPRPKERILDLCAAPGGKTTHLAALAHDEATIVALERDPRRARALEETCRRMHATSVTVRVADARTPLDGERFDRVLVDPPCSGLGTLRSRPDLRWRATPADVEALTQLQDEILDAAARATRPGGTLVYSTCTISPPENEHRVDAFLARHPEFRPDDLTSDHPLWHHPHVPSHLQTLPHRDGTDGFFVARLRRAP